LPAVFGSRIALNVYFWLFLCFFAFVLNFNGAHRQYVYPVTWYYLFRTITVLLLATLLYVNNLWLVPSYLMAGKKGKYFLLVSTLTYITGLCYSAFFAILGIYFPKITISDVSVISALQVVYPVAWYVLIFFQAISWSFVLFISVFVFTVTWYMHDYQRQKKVSEEAQKKQIETELNFLKSQVNPHFLFNTLNNLYTLTIKKSDDAPAVVMRLSSILRYLLYESNTNEVSFEKEKEIAQAYIDLELLRMNNKNNMHFTIESDKPYHIYPLLWVPILENVFKHGTRFISDNYNVDFRFSIQNGELSIYSKNSFKPPDEPNKNGRIGLSNLEKRLALLFPGRHKFVVSVEGDFFIAQVNIHLP